MTDIDVKTGLPKLPDNFFWNIKSYSAYGGDRLYISLMERVTRVVRPARWFRREKTDIVHDVRSSMYVHYTQPKTYKNHATAEAAVKKLGWISYTIDPTWDESKSEDRYSITSYDLSKALILETVEKVLIRFEEGLAQKAIKEAARLEREQWVGDYPPKKFSA